MRLETREDGDGGGGNGNGDEERNLPFTPEVQAQRIAQRGFG
jgi:hypothetical protein